MTSTSFLDNDLGTMHTLFYQDFISACYDLKDIVGGPFIVVRQCVFDT